MLQPISPAPASHEYQQALPQRLGTPHEQCLELGPLTVESGLDLFVQRARSVRAELALDASTQGTLRKIVQRLDTIPLSLRMAASTLSILSPSQLLDRLDERTLWLSRNDRLEPDRHSSLRASVAWSWSLLPAHSRDTAASLSVFRGGFTVEATEAVLGPSALDSLMVLRDASLIHVASLSPPRLAFYEPIREFAAERLEASGRAEAVCRAHADWVFEVALRAQDSIEATLRALPERANLQAAWQRASPPQDQIRGAFAISQRALGQIDWTAASVVDEAIALARQHQPRDVLQLLCRKFWIRFRYLRSLDGAEDLIDEIESLIAHTEDPIGHAHAHHIRGVVAYHQGDPRTAVTEFADAIERYVRAGLQADADSCRLGLAQSRVFVDGDSEENIATHIELARSPNIRPADRLTSLHWAGHLLRGFGRPEEARPLLREALSDAQALHHIPEQIRLLSELAYIAVDTGRPLDAIALAREAHDVCPRLRRATPRRALGHAHLALDAFEEADTQLSLALAFGTRPSFLGSVLISRALCRALAGDLDASREDVRAAAVNFEQQSPSNYTQICQCMEVVLDAVSGQPEAARARLQELPAEPVHDVMAWRDRARVAVVLAEGGTADHANIQLGNGNRHHIWWVTRLIDRRLRPT